MYLKIGPDLAEAIRYSASSGTGVALDTDMGVFIISLSDWIEEEGGDQIKCRKAVSIRELAASKHPAQLWNLHHVALRAEFHGC